MNAIRGFFSLVQYCPDLARQEAANVGVVLFCPEPHFLRARLAGGNHRIRKFFGEEADQYRHLDAMKEALTRRLEIESGSFRSPEDLRVFGETRANKIVLSPPKPVRITDPVADLEALYRELVEEPRPPLSERAALPLRRRLDEALATDLVRPRVQRDLTVDVPTLHRLIKVPYGFRNGRLNLIQPVEFTQRSVARVANAACRVAVEGRSLFEHRHPSLGDLQLVVVAGFREGDPESLRLVTDLFSEYRVRLFTPDNLIGLADEIVAHGQPVDAA